MNNYKPPFKITNKILNLVSEITNILGKISYLNNLDKHPRLRKHNRLKSVQSSCSIENNTITLKEAAELIDGKAIGNGSIKEQAEIINAYKAYDLINEINPYDLNDLLKVHKVMINDLAPESGTLRSRQVCVMNGDVMIHIGPSHKLVPTLITQLFD